MTLLPLALSTALLVTGAANWCLSLQHDVDARIEIDREFASLASDTSQSLHSILQKNRALNFIEGLCVGSAALAQPGFVANLRKVARALAVAQDIEWKVLQAKVYAKTLKQLPVLPKLSSPERSKKRLCTPGALLWPIDTVLEVRAWRELAGIEVKIESDTRPSWSFRHEGVRRRLGH